MANEKDSGPPAIARNRKAFRDFHIEERLEAGIKLTGTEIKAVREGRVNLADSFATAEGGEVFLHNMHIGPYSHGTIYNHEARRSRKLLLHKREIDYLYGKTQEQGYTLVPLKLYLKRGWVKVDLAIAKGKREFDKRETVKKRDAERKMRQAMRRRR
ncbi:MAG: SsrA-binding protein SmpB [Bacillota bacterium]